MNYILEFLLYCPRVYSGLDRLMVELTQQANRARLQGGMCVL